MSQTKLIVARSVCQSDWFHTYIFPWLLMLSLCACKQLTALWFACASDAKIYFAVSAQALIRWENTLLVAVIKKKLCTCLYSKISGVRWCLVVLLSIDFYSYSIFATVYSVHACGWDLKREMISPPLYSRVRIHIQYFTLWLWLWHADMQSVSQKTEVKFVERCW